MNFIKEFKMLLVLFIGATMLFSCAPSKNVKLDFSKQISEQEQEAIQSKPVFNNSFKPAVESDNVDNN